MKIRFIFLEILLTFLRNTLIYNVILIANWRVIMRLSKNEIKNALFQMEKENYNKSDFLTDKVSVLEYESETFDGIQNGKTVKVWTKAFQKAISEHEVIYIPKSGEPYYIDDTIIVSSNRKIIADDGAVICQMEGVDVLLMRNEHVEDGTHFPIKGDNTDENITIIGGRWEESHRAFGGSGITGKYDKEGSYFGIFACFHFNNLKNLTIKNVNIAHSAGFGIQICSVKNVVVDNVEFTSCYADGLHVNGYTSYLLARNIRGEVGDDLFALNMYDWQMSSVSYGPIDMVYAENLHSYDSSRYKALRILPGIYYYDDGSSVDCSLTNIVINGVKGINTYKFYYQTPPYLIADKNPERGGTGSGDNIYFENIDIDLHKPVDWLEPYYNSDPVRGDFAAFELGSNLGVLSLENINLKIYKDKYPYSYLVSIGPKSVQMGEKEIFDPYVSSKLQKLYLSNIKVNGEVVIDFTDYVKEIKFDDLYGDGFSSGCGEIEEIILKN